MSDRIKSLALFTTIYPGVEPFLKDWYASLRSQTDQDFQVWIGLDELTSAAAIDAMGGDPDATWIPAPPGDSPAQVRQRALEDIVTGYDAVVMVDSDDILHPTRIASARAALETSDLNGCALRLVDVQGQDLGLSFRLPEGKTGQDILPRNNVYGLSNTAYRSDTLRRCLPIPTETALIDWYLATRAWLLGARLSFDQAVRMDYRQHGANMARVRPPFSPQVVVEDTALVRRHFRIITASLPEGALPERIDMLRQTAMEVESFHRNIVLQPDKLAHYVEELNAARPHLLWWSCVAHPSQRHMWT